MYKLGTTLIYILIIQLTLFFPVSGSANDTTGNLYIEQKALYEKVESLTLIPWYYLAAINQYERSIMSSEKRQNFSKRYIYIEIPPAKWSGMLNPNQQDSQMESISFFGGIGLDGDGDGIASLTSDADVLYTFAFQLSQYGATEEDIRIGLWEYYKRSDTVRIIQQFAEIYRHFQKLDLFNNAFPIVRGYNYSYHNTWGDPRGWGGRRIHEGVDIFAGYGTPIRSTSYGYIEVIGWNNYGGWRVGIRDLNNVYHYYAHLSGFNKEIKQGSIVIPGQIIGYVGSSGYGKPGTSGKFMAHLHYGMYKFNGKNQWAFNPYSYLKRWEREERIKKK